MVVKGITGRNRYMRKGSAESDGRTYVRGDGGDIKAGAEEGRLM